MFVVHTHTGRRIERLYTAVAGSAPPSPGRDSWHSEAVGTACFVGVSLIGGSADGAVDSLRLTRLYC